MANPTKLAIATLLAAGVTSFGLLFTGSNEGMVNAVYKDTAKYNTVCLGHLVLPSDSAKAILADCVGTFKQDYAKHDAAVSACAANPFYRTPALSQGQRAAFVDLSFNIGEHGFCKSSVARLARERRLSEACAATKLFNMADGKIDQGLVSRRARAYTVCMASDAELKVMLQKLIAIK